MRAFWAYYGIVLASSAIAFLPHRSHDLEQAAIEISRIADFDNGGPRALRVLQAVQDESRNVIDLSGRGLLDGGAQADQGRYNAVSPSMTDVLLRSNVSTPPFKDMTVFQILRILDSWDNTRLRACYILRLDDRATEDVMYHFIEDDGDAVSIKVDPRCRQVAEQLNVGADKCAVTVRSTRQTEHQFTASSTCSELTTTISQALGATAERLPRENLKKVVALVSVDKPEAAIARLRAIEDHEAGAVTVFGVGYPGQLSLPIAFVASIAMSIYLLAHGIALDRAKPSTDEPSISLLTLDNAAASISRALLLAFAFWVTVYVALEISADVEDALAQNVLDLAVAFGAVVEMICIVWVFRVAGKQRGRLRSSAGELDQPVTWLRRFYSDFSRTWKAESLRRSTRRRKDPQ